MPSDPDLRSFTAAHVAPSFTDALPAYFQSVYPGFALNSPAQPSAAAAAALSWLSPSRRAAAALPKPPPPPSDAERNASLALLAEVTASLAGPPPLVTQPRLPAGSQSGHSAALEQALAQLGWLPPAVADPTPVSVGPVSVATALAARTPKREPPQEGGNTELTGAAVRQLKHVSLSLWPPSGPPAGQVQTSEDTKPALPNFHQSRTSQDTKPALPNFQQSSSWQQRTSPVQPVIRPVAQAFAPPQLREQEPTRSYPAAAAALAPRRAAQDVRSFVQFGQEDEDAGESSDWDSGDPGDGSGDDADSDDDGYVPKAASRLTAGRGRRRGRGGRQRGTGRLLTFQDLEAHFGTGRGEAAEKLGICATTLKRACRRHGIQRWPGRRAIKMLKRQAAERAARVAER